MLGHLPEHAADQRIEWADIRSFLYDFKDGMDLHDQSEIVAQWSISFLGQMKQIDGYERVEKQCEDIMNIILTRLNWTKPWIHFWKMTSLLPKYNLITSEKKIMTPDESRSSSAGSGTGWPALYLCLLQIPTDWACFLVVTDAFTQTKEHTRETARVQSCGVSSFVRARSG